MQAMVSDFRIDDLVNFEMPISLYIVVPAADRIRLRLRRARRGMGETVSMSVRPVETDP